MKFVNHLKYRRYQIPRNIWVLFCLKLYVNTFFMCIVKFSLFQSSLLLLVNDSLENLYELHTYDRKTDQKFKALNFWANDS